MDNSIGEYYDTSNWIYLAAGGANSTDNSYGGTGGGGSGSSIYDDSITYYGINGSGGGGYGNVGAVGGDGIIILRFLDQLVSSIEIPESVLDLSLIHI